MKKAIKTAVLGSIIKWDCIAQGIHYESKIPCPLCVIFSGCKNCVGCPVAAQTGAGGCLYTPYYDTNLEVGKTLSEDLEANMYNIPNLDAVEAEIEFLISLLPENHEMRKLWI